MQSLRLKFGTKRSDWTCCFCCHVRVGTIFLGMFHLIINMLTLAMLTVTIRYPELMDPDMGDNILPTPLSEVDIPGFKFIAYNTEMRGDGMGYQEPPVPYAYRTLAHLSQREWNLSVFFTIITIMLSLLLIYGAIKRKAHFIMPFFGFQVFNFCISSMAVVGYLCFPPNVNQMIRRTTYVPFKQDLLEFDAQTLNLYVVVALILAMVIKAYFIGVVWSCYKFLALRQMAAQRTLHFIDPANQSLVNDLPDYDAAVRKQFPQPPPSYAAAVGNQTVVVDGATVASSSATEQPTAMHPQLLTVRAPVPATSEGLPQQV